MSERRLPKALARRVAGPVVLIVSIVTAIAVGAPGSGATGPAVTPTTTAPSSAPPTAGPSNSPSSSPSPSATPSGSPSPSEETTSTEPTTDPSAPSGGPVQSTGQPGTDAPGITMTVTPRSNGDLVVQQTVWLSSPTATLQLSPPSIVTAGQQFSRVKPQLRDLVISAEGRSIPLQDTTVTTPRTVPLATAASAYTVSYTLQGAVVRSTPSVPGRALGAVRPLLFADQPQLPVLVNVTGAAPLSVTCPELGDAETNCAGPTDTGYRLSTPIAAARALVLIQLDLTDA